MREISSGEWCVYETEHLFGFSYILAKKVERVRGDGTVEVNRYPVTIADRPDRLDDFSWNLVRRSVMMAGASEGPWAYLTGISEVLSV